MVTDSRTTPDLEQASFEVDVHYAKPGQHWIRTVRVEQGTPLSEIVQRSGVTAAWPEVADHDAGFGLDGKLAAPDTVVLPGQRVEVYRPLTFDPMVSRRRRAAHRARRSR